MRVGSATRPFQASQAAARRQRKCGEVFRHARLSGGMAAWPPFLFTTEKAGQGRPARTICRTIADARGSDRISLRHAPIGRDNALKSPASREMGGLGRMTMVFRFRRSVVGFVVLGCLAAVTPAAAQKPGGILQMLDFASPASMSIHEESTITAGIPMMGVFNNLVVLPAYRTEQ